MDKSILDNWALDQGNPELTLQLADWYLKYGQLSAALTHYLKVAEDLPESEYEARYHCLMMMAYIYKTQGNRWDGVSQFLRFAKAEMPDRPESYAMLAENIADKLYHNGVYEAWGWIEVYENARIGLMYAMKSDRPTCVYYKGINTLKIYYLISLLRLNKHDDLKDALKEFQFNDLNGSDFDALAYIYNELRLDCPYTHVSEVNLTHIKDEYEVDLSKYVTKNYSQAMQDIFAIIASGNIQHGTYLEIGSADPTYGSNTKLLEELDWIGISIDYNSWFVNQFNEQRKNICYQADALNFDYMSAIEAVIGKGTSVIDYLSLDIDPAENTLECLYRLPLDKIKFKCITFEHDSYAVGQNVRNAQYKYLTAAGYSLVCSDIKYDSSHSFEDWWVHTDYLKEVHTKLRNRCNNVKGVPFLIF